MAEVTLNNIISTDKDFHNRRDPAVRMESLFMQTLQIEKLVDSLFTFRTKAARTIASNLIHELSQDYGLISHRQEALKYLIDSPDYAKFQGIFDNICGQYTHLEDLLHPTPGMGMPFGRTAGMHMGITELNSMYGLLDNLIYYLGQFKDLAKGSIFAEIGITLQQIFISESYTELASKFPLSKGYKFKSIPVESANSSDDVQDADFDDADFDDADYDDEEDSISEYSHLFHQIEWYHQSFYNLVVILDYFMSYAKGFRKLREMGASIVFPEIVNNKGVRLCDIREAVNPLLYAGTNIPNPKIPNDILSSEFSTLRLITGENEYGKSFYIMARGIFQAFGQAGLPVIAKSARMTLVDKILANIGLTHDVLHAKSTYKVINSTTYELAKLARGRSLMILDEPTSGTYDLKAVVQGKAYIEGIAEAGNEAWVVTHHLELAETAKRYPNAEVLTTETRDGKPTYRIVSGIFQPTEATVHLDYPKEMLRASMSGDYATRLRKLMEKEGISAEHRERLENMLGRIEIKS